MTETRRIIGIRWIVVVRAAVWMFVAAMLSGLAWSWISGGFIARILDPNLTASARLEVFRAGFLSAGYWAPLLFIAFTCGEVIIAPIPGLMLYAPGGLIFGPWLGGTLALVGNAIGAGIACSLARTFGERWLARIADDSSIARLQTMLERRGFWLLVLLRLNPLTSSDLLSYAAGFTKIPTWQVMLATTLGMAPLCYLQSWLSDSVFHRWPFLLWPLLICGIVYVLVVVIILIRTFQLSRKKLSHGR